MTIKMRWRFGDTNPVVAAVDAATEISAGDLVYQDVDDARPASAQSDQETLAANQALFAQKFLGIAMQTHLAGSAGVIRVATTGAFELECPSTAFELGDLVGAVENAAGTALLNQQVAKVADAQHALGRVVRRSSAATSVLVEICSTVMTGGVLPRATT